MMKPLLFVLMLTLSLSGFSQKGTAKTPDSKKPFVLGWVDEITSKVLGEKRVLNIYLPEGYQASDTVRYPVIYLLDGSRDEDFIHVVGLVQFNSFPWVKRLPPSIVVGIANVDRQRDFTYPTTVEADRKRYPNTGHSAAFISFLETELQPYIDRQYRTNGSRMLIGESLGGLLATEILLKRPGLFDKYVIISPSLWWDNGSLLSQSTDLLQKNGRATQVYIGVGKEGLTGTEPPRVMEVDANLLADKLMALKQDSLHVFFDYLPTEDHATIAHQALYNAFRLLYAAK